MSSIPVNKKLYEKVKREAKKKFKSWPSVYASSWLVREYKKRGGTYKGKKTSDNGLSRWYREQWVDTCYWPKRVVRCGRYRYSPKKYPYCRPSVKVSPKTPRTVQTFSKKEREKLCRKKRKSPRRKISYK